MAKLLSFLGRNRLTAPDISRNNTDELDPLKLPPMTAPELFSYLKLDNHILSIKRLASVNDHYWNTLYQATLNNVADAIQLLPASAAHHHAGPGGLLTHTIEVCANTMRIAKGWQLPLGVGPEERARLEPLWRYGLFAAALLHDMGKTLALVRITLDLKNGQSQPWSPWLGKMPSNTQSYRVDFQMADYQLYHPLSVTLMDLLPRSARHWLLQDMKLVKQLLAWLNNDPYECGEVGEIVRQADRESTAADLKLGGHQKRFPGVYQLPMIDRLMTALRHLLQDGTLKINRNGAAAWIYQGRAYLVCRTVAQAVQQYLSEQGATDIPSDPTRLYDTWQEHGYALENSEGGAIWKVNIKGENYDLTLTVLVFEATRLFKVGHLPANFKGTIKALSQDTVIEESQTAVDHNDNTVTEIKAHNNTATDTENTVTEAAITQIKPQLKPVLDESADPFDLSNSTNTETEQADTAQANAQKTATDPDITDTGSSSSVTEKTDLAQPKVHHPLDSGAVIQDVHDAPKPNAPEVGQFFVDWIKRSIADKSFRVNRADTPVHIVSEGVVLVSPKILQLFCEKMKYKQITGKKMTWMVVQSQFHKLKIHIKTDKHYNVHKFQINGDNRTSYLNGYLLPFDVFFDEGKVPPVNKKLAHIG